MTPAVIERLGALHTHPRGAPVYRQGDPVTDVYFLKKGHVNLTVGSSSGREAFIGRVDPGDFFGEESLVLLGPISPDHKRERTHTAVTATDVIDVVLPVDVLREAFHANPDLSVTMIEHLARRNLTQQGDLLDQMLNNTERRLARALCHQLRLREGLKNNIEISNIRQHELAEIVSTSRARVNSYMTNWRKLGLIDYDASRDGTIIIKPAFFRMALGDCNEENYPFPSPPLKLKKLPAREG